MIVIINNNLQGVASVYNTSGSVNKIAKAYQQAETAQDDIQISQKGQEFSEILKKLRSGSDVREDKVTEYENLIASGAYQVSTSDLADKILQYRY